MKLFGRVSSKGHHLPEGRNDPDEDLASNAGFEIGVEEAPAVPSPSSSGGASKGFLGRFRKPTEASSLPSQAPTPQFSVQEYQPSIKVTNHDDNPNDVTTDLDDEEYATDPREGGVTTKSGEAAAAAPKTWRERKLAFEAWYYDEQRQERIQKAAPYCIGITLVLLLAMLLGLIIGLLQKDFGASSPRTSTGIGAATVKVQIEFDDRPEEIGWKVLTQGDWQVIHEVAEGTYDGSEGSINEEVDLEWGKDYLFRITDAGQDGMSVGTTGSWSVFFRSEELGSGEGDFGSEQVISFFMNKELGVVNVTGWQKDPSA
jgi:hypothetical protein